MPYLIRLQYIFQLTPSRRATSTRSPQKSKQRYFNSRPHGGRLAWLVPSFMYQYFNSRPHGGRRGYTSGIPGDRDFNSRPHGGRHIFIASNTSRLVFQLTPSRRATIRRCTAETGLLYFNSRPHGGRPIIFMMAVTSGIFQLTPSRRATSIP